MRRPRRILARVVAVLAASATVGLITLTPASADARGRIVSIDTNGDQIEVVFSGVGLPDGTSFDTSSVKLTINGQPVDATATSASGSTTHVQRTAMLTIDTSGSMAGAGIAGAKSAALLFLDKVPADVHIGLVTFSNNAALRSPPTTNRDHLRTIIRGLAPHGNTALYDAVSLSLSALGGSGARTDLLLTDGTDDGSKKTLQQVTSQARSSGATINAVAFRTAAASGGALRVLTGATGGHVVSASEAVQITQAFNAAAQEIANEIVITAPIPQNLAGKSVTVSVTGTAGGQTVSDVAARLLPQVTQPASPGAHLAHPADVSSGLATGWVALAAVLLFVAFAVIIAIALVSVVGEDRQAGVRRRLSVYTLTGRVTRESEEQQTTLGTSAIARSAVELAGRVVQGADFETGLARRLEAAAVPLRPAEWMLIHVGSALGLGLILLILSGGSLLPAIIGVIIGVVGPFMFLTVREERRRSAFLEALPDTLQLIAGSLSAGYSLPQAVDTVVKEGNPAVATEFNRALVEARLGMPVEDALEGVAHRMRSTDFGWVVMAIRIQREVGGNLAEVLTTVADTLRDRERIRRQVQVLSAEGRLSAYILGGLPILFALYLVLVRYDYISTLWKEAAGIVMLVIAAVLLTVGMFWLRKVVRVEV